MTDSRADELGDEDRLPWLEAVEEDDEPGGPSIARLIGAIVIGLVAIAAVVGGLFWLADRNRSDGNGEVIAAPEGDYKVRPEEPGGMNVSGEGGTAAAASTGAQPTGRIDTGAVPEAPISRPSQPGQAAPPAPRAPTAPQTGGPAAAPPGVIQLGAFSSQAAATRAWRGLSGRFSYLAPLSHSIAAVQSGGRTLYRLRASGPGAPGICRRLQVAGEDCAIVD